MDVAQDGSLSGLEYFVEDGEFSVVEGQDGLIYIADGDVQVYDATGKHIRTITVPERPSTLSVFGGKLYVTTRSSLYGIDL